MLNYMSLIVVVAYDICLRVTEEELKHTWKDNNIVDFWKFCDLLSNKNINYNPINWKYAGETNMRPDVQQNQSARDRSKDSTRG